MRRVSLPDDAPLFGPGDRRKTINLKELCGLSGIGIPTLRDWVRRGIILGAFQRKKSAKWRFRRELLEKWWEALLTRHTNPEAAQPYINYKPRDKARKHRKKRRRKKG